MSRGKSKAAVSAAAWLLLLHAFKSAAWTELKPPWPGTHCSKNSCADYVWCCELHCTEYIPHVGRFGAAQVEARILAGMSLQPRQQLTECLRLSRAICRPRALSRGPLPAAGFSLVPTAACIDDALLGTAGHYRACSPSVGGGHAEQVLGGGLG